MEIQCKNTEIWKWDEVSSSRWVGIENTKKKRESATYHVKNGTVSLLGFSFRAKSRKSLFQLSRHRQSMNKVYLEYLVIPGVVV